MFEDLIQEFDVLSKYVAQYDYAEMDLAIRGNIAVASEEALKNELLKSAEAALTSVSEFNYPAYRKQLLSNLQKPGHYYVSLGLKSFQVFDPQLAGDYSDILAGQRAGGGPGSGTPKQNYNFWKYGIYMPGRMGWGDKARKMGIEIDKYPNYDEIIEMRIDEWGDKAPFWVFLEFGNQGGGLAYPSFPGTGFIQRVRNAANSIIKEIADKEYKRWIDGVAGVTGDQLTNTENVNTVSIRGKPYKGEQYYIEERVSSKGNVWYQLVTPGRFMRKVEPGEYVKEIGSVFRP
jgi:hypothetical protein